MTNLKRGCNACISAKRRCNRELPQCSRCRRLAKACQYVHKPGQAAVWTGHRTCKLASRTTQQTEIIILPKLAVTPSGGKVMDVDYIDWMSPSRSVFTNLSLSERGVAMCLIISHCRSWSIAFLVCHGNMPKRIGPASSANV